eukprot:scaffold7785_cov73-Cylindrotheca_fusiformis.AAC.3
MQTVPWEDLQSSSMRIEEASIDMIICHFQGGSNDLSATSYQKDGGKAGAGVAGAGVAGAGVAAGAAVVAAFFDVLVVPFLVALAESLVPLVVSEGDLVFLDILGPLVDFKVGDLVDFVVGDLADLGDFKPLAMVLVTTSQLPDRRLHQPSRMIKDHLLVDQQGFVRDNICQLFCGAHRYCLCGQAWLH